MEKVNPEAAGRPDLRRQILDFLGGYVDLTPSPKPEFLDQEVYNKLYQCPIGLQHADQVCQETANCTHELRSSATDPKSAEGKFDDYAVKIPLSGHPVTIPSTELLGRISNLSKLSQYLAEKIGSDRSRVERNLRRLTGQAPQAQRQQAAKWFSRRVKENVNGPFAISPPTCWLFRQDTNKDVRKMMFDDEAQVLPIRLALPQFPPFERIGEVDFIGFCVAGHRITGPVAPSIFDAGYISAKYYWFPGGWTVPLRWAPQKCQEGGGIREVVAKAPTYNDIEDEVFLVRSMAVENED